MENEKLTRACKANSATSTVEPGLARRVSTVRSTKQFSYSQENRRLHSQQLPRLVPQEEYRLHQAPTNSDHPRIAEHLPY
jgi:hypothetical protein